VAGSVNGRANAGERPAPPAASQRGERQWVELAIDLLRSLIQLRTINPPGREEAAAVLLGRFAERAGLRSRIVPVAPGRAHAVLDLPGLNPDLDPVVAVAHLDVVRPGPGWTKPPFAAVLENGYLWGRGAIDAKGVAAVWATILARRAATGTPPPRTLRLIAAAGEEHPTGALRATLDAHPDLARARVAFGEGGGYIRGQGGRWFTAVGVAECGRAHLPGSPPQRSPLPAPARPPGPLRAFLEALAEDQPDQRRELAALLAAFPAGADTRADAFQNWVERVARTFALEAAAVAAMTAAQPLATPRPRGAARGRYAVPPGATPPPGSRWAWPPSESALNHLGYRAIATTLAGEVLPGLGATRPLPVLTRGRTDLAWFRTRGVPSFGLLPLDPTDRPESVHGPDERLSIAAIRRSLRVLEAIALQVAADPRPEPPRADGAERQPNSWEAHT
jgi:acetylornithine deacetylase/succinyl-diaminopimelate desuccinylase-like protein